MDTIVLWVALIGVIGTLVGVLLGNWMQSRNVKRQREWMIQDQKREWVRRRRLEEFERILEYVEGTLEYLLKAESVIKTGSDKRKEEIILKHAEQAASAMPVARAMLGKGKDKELADLLLKFAQNGDDINSALLAKDPSKLDAVAQSCADTAALIRQRINVLLEETFD